MDNTETVEWEITRGGPGIWWLVIDIFCIKMWWIAGNWAMVVMYIFWTANTIYGWFNWSKLNKEQNR